MTDLQATDSPAARLDARLAGLRQALANNSEQVPASLSMPANRELDAVEERLALGVDHTVVALFGGTGSGKSSLFNALTGLEFADVGARRPMTSRAASCSWGDDATALLTFLGVDADRRIRRDSILESKEHLEGLVLLDVPDYDSVSTEHALQVDRLVPMADILVWVLDPQKYADSALHDGYLRDLGAREEDMLILINQVDTLPAGGQDKLLADVQTLLREDGLNNVTVIPVSAKRGDGLDQVAEILQSRVRRESNAARTASAEMDRISTRLLPAVAGVDVHTSDAERDELISALEKSSGVKVVAESIGANLAKVMPGALARPEAPARSAVLTARQRWLRSTTKQLPTLWSEAVEEGVSSGDVLAAQTTESVASVRLPMPRLASIELLWWGGLLLVLGGLAGIVASVVVGNSVVAPIAVVVIGCLAAIAGAYLRRRRAGEQAELYTTTVRERLELLAERSMTTPATAVLERHNALRAVLTARGELNDWS